MNQSDAVYKFIKMTLLSVIFIVYSFVILNHFEGGAYLEDSGWFAYLFEQKNPLLLNPPGINKLSFYAHHISPFLYLWGRLTCGLLGINGVYAFAIYNGLAHVLTAIGLLMVADNTPRLLRKYFNLILIFLFVIGFEYILRANGYPHYEMMTLGLCSIFTASYLNKKPVIMVLAALLALLVREDAGLYLVYCALSATMIAGSNPSKFKWNDLPRWHQVSLCAVAILASFGVLASFVIKAKYFPGFATMESNISGNHFSHVDLDLLKERGWSLLSHMGPLPLLLAICLLGFVSYVYLAPLILMMPMLILHLVAVRSELGLFTLYYGIPFVFIAMLTLFCFFKINQEKFSWVSVVLILFLVLGSSGLVQSKMYNDKHQDYVTNRLMFHIPKLQVGAYKKFIDSTFLKYNDKKICGTIGVVALEAQRFDHLYKIDNPMSDACDLVMTFKGDMDYQKQIIETGVVLNSPVLSYEQIEVYKLHD